MGRLFGCYIQILFGRIAFSDVVRMSVKLFIVVNHIPKYNQFSYCNNVVVSGNVTHFVLCAETYILTATHL